MREDSVGQGWNRAQEMMGGGSHHMEPPREGAGLEPKSKEGTRFCRAVHVSLSSGNGSLHAVGSHEPEAQPDGSFQKLRSPLGTDLPLTFYKFSCPPSI